MLNKNVHQPHSASSQMWQLTQNMRSDQMTSARKRWQDNLGLEPFAVWHRHFGSGDLSQHSTQLELRKSAQRVQPFGQCRGRARLHQRFNTLPRGVGNADSKQQCFEVVNQRAGVREFSRCQVFSQRLFSETSFLVGNQQTNKIRSSQQR